MIKRTKSNGADSTPQAGESTPTFRDNAEVNAKIDTYIQENPKYWQYVQSMPRERMERAMVLTKVQQQERQQKLDQGVLKKIEGDPELKQSLHALVKDLPELAAHENTIGVSFLINRYFAEHPAMMCGHMASEGTMYSEGEPALVPDERPLDAALSHAIAHLPSDIYRHVETQSASQADDPAEIPAPDGVKEGAFTLHEGQVAVRKGGTLVLSRGLPSETTRRIRGLIQIRESVREVLRTQLEESGDSAILAARQQLNLRYDQFVARFGPVSTTGNRRAFRNDPDYPLLCSLENFNHETKQATKTAIFRERTIHSAAPVLKAETAKDALVVTLNERGKVDLEHMAALLGKEVSDFTPELKGLIYLDPETSRWETEDSYLFGNVREKLAAAQRAARDDPRFQENVEALQAVQPEDLPPSQIEACLGAAWIPETDVEAFASSLLGNNAVSISHSPQVGAWFVQGSPQAKVSVAHTTPSGARRGIPRSI